MGMDKAMTNHEQLHEWFKRGLDQNARYMIVVCDTFDHEDYPVYAKTDAECIKEYDAHDGKNMQRIMEVYDLKKSWKSQSGYRVFTMPKRP